MEELILPGDDIIFTDINVRLINMDLILYNSYYTVSKYIELYDIPRGLSNKDMKSLLYHHVITELCDKLENKDHYNMLYHGGLISTNKTFNNTCRFILNKISSLMPLQFIEGNLGISTFSRLYYDGNTECVNILKYHVSKHLEFDVSTFSFKKMKKFLKQFDLQQLEGKFDDCKLKSSIIS